MLFLPIEKKRVQSMLRVAEISAQFFHILGLDWFYQRQKGEDMDIGLIKSDLESTSAQIVDKSLDLKKEDKEQTFSDSEHQNQQKNPEQKQLQVNPSSQGQAKAENRLCRQHTRGF
jgi:hypothetical protein